MRGAEAPESYSCPSSVREGVGKVRVDEDIEGVRYVTERGVGTRLPRIILVELDEDDEAEYSRGSSSGNSSRSSSSSRNSSSSNNRK